MDSDYPPLPSAARSRKDPASRVSRDFTLGDSSAKCTTPRPARNGYRGEGVMLSGSNIIYKVLSRNGDTVLEYTDDHSHHSKAPTVRYRWQISSDRLMGNSPYFSALLDPNKFAEGKQFKENKSRSAQKYTWTMTSSEQFDSADGPTDEYLPLVRLNVSRLSGKYRIDILELFLKVLLLNDHDEEQWTRLHEEIRYQPVSLIAGMIDVAEQFNSPQIVYDTLKRASYVPSVKGKLSLTTFSPSLLKLSEERIRQIIHIAIFLDDQSIFQVLSHSLILLGSSTWVNGVGIPDSNYPRWSYLPNGLEEELYFRRQCVLNTITDLQAHFLRVYGALEEDSLENKTPPNGPVTPTPSPVLRHRLIQCRWGFSNSRACDSFHLGEMIRFFSLRSKTIYLGSTLIDPVYENGPSDDDDDFLDSNTTTTPPAPVSIPGDILSITATLRQIPDYQIDINHTGCGIRRRLLPALDCIDRYTGHGKGLLGPILHLGKASSDLYRNSWIKHSQPSAEAVFINGPRIISFGVSVTADREEEAKLFFTAKKRNWES